ncbi:hypothetical protein C8T65DRAFT_303288 [Cerioporus squamosus]|nr:hypothetical protein C8T65DRAFT_303288 [Cerioporus squamosus]
MSDASYMRGASDSGASNTRGFARGVSNSEPLAVLADLQEFGIPGQEVPLPPGTNVGLSTPNSNFNSKRFSDASAGLPPLNEDEYLDMDLVRPRSTATSSSHATPARPPPPTIPLPSPPGQQQPTRPKRAGSFDTLSSLDTLADNDFVPIKSLPVPKPRRMASSDTISSSSSRDARSDRGQFSPARGSSPAPVVRPSPRPFSIMSHSTEQDLLAIAEMLSPAVEAGAEEEPIPEGPPMAELESFGDMFGEEPAVPNPARDSVSSTMSSLYSSYQRESSVGASTRGSIYTDSDGASYFGDDLPDPSLLAAPFLQHGLRNLHLPRGSLPMPPLDDTRSLSSSTSYSSLRTPSLSRTSSVAYLSSPPVSPTSSYSPVDAPGPSSPHNSMQPPNSKLLGIIEEHFHSEEGHGHSRHTSEATETITLDDCFEETRSSQSYAPRPRTRTAGSPRGAIREERCAAPPAHCTTATRRAISGTRTGGTTRGRKCGVPPEAPRQAVGCRNCRSSRSHPPRLLSRLPRARHQRVVTVQPAGVCATDTLGTPLDATHASLRARAALFVFVHGQAFWVHHEQAPPFSDEEQSPYKREMQSPFGKMQNAYPAEQYNGYNGDLRTPHTPDTPSSFQTARTPTFAHSEAERNVQKLQKTERFVPPPPPPVPPSPVLSATSSSSSHKSIKKAVGLGKLFGKGGDKSSKKSSEGGGSTFSSGQSVSSLDLGSSKAEEKRLKREAAKARTERLAQDLAEKTKRRAEAAKAQKGAVAKERSKKPWEEGAGGLYEGISYF